MTNMTKILAVITMIIDHIGMIFFPEAEALRIIGRLSLPLFAYCLAEGYSHTKNVKNYIYRLTGFAIAAQIPYSIIFQERLNILFAFAFSILLLLLKDKYNKWIYLFLIPASLLNMEYGIYSIILVIIFHEFRNKKAMLITAITIATLIYSVSIDSTIQLFALVSLLAVKYLKKIPLKINKYIFYAIYPAQWAVIAIIRIMIPS